ncbi:MAG: hypothetical protein JRI68_25695 [Deltaproteobacteria bacterium]|nr:hypothetical protein [Deltaproteobacteria bacterium]
MSKWSWQVSWLAIPMVGALAVHGCAQGVASFDDDGTGGSSSGTGGSATSSGGGEGGTTSGTGGTAGHSSACEVDCSQIQAPICQVAQCNEATGQCEVVADQDGTECDDGVFCTVDDACVAGVCQPGPANDCGITPPDCTEITCDENSQACSTQALPNGAACVPTDLCLENTTCTNGICAGTTKDCFMQPVPDDCHESVCNPQNGQCEPVPGNEGQNCTDANDLCTVNKTCASGVCQGGVPKDCSNLTLDCVLGVCDANTGQCTTQSLNNGDPCDDLDPCTNGELCNNGSCAGGTPVTQCIAADSCCPSGCTPSNDTDCAIQTLDVGPHGSNYSSSSSTRGYWYQAPVAHTIKELRVPTEVGTLGQNIQVVRFNSGAPPNFSSSTTDFVTLAYHQNVPGSNWIAVNIPVQAGQWIGILGARGTTTMNNSYGSGNPYNTTMLGHPVALNRLVYQANVYTTQAGPLSAETGGSYCRIEMRYSP